MPGILDFLEQHRVIHSTTHHHSRRGWVQLEECPYCHSNNYHLGITLDGRRCSCYKCGGHNAPKTLQIVSGASWTECRGICGTPDESAPEPVYGVYKPPVGVVDLLPADRAYLEGRGFDPDELVAAWKIQSMHPASGMAGIFIPISYKGRFVSWTIRFREPKGNQRYKTAADDEKSMPEKHLLFGAEHCLNTVIVVEGPLDAMMVGPGAVALFGLQYTRQQLYLLSQYHRRVVCFDSESAAQARASDLCQDLAAFGGETLQVQLDADDPGCASKQEIAELRKIAGL